ncbi:hypothetical protein R1flu_015462 [Riccia fluitans]|uniref:Late embryogenesis abundant protein LEA-2 subgroup domain-containing protein n=1 Tax=Riccia fluitans TaxID=41844 RepID=A0ABD1YJ22_9MARC
MAFQLSTRNANTPKTKVIQRSPILESPASGDGRDILWLADLRGTFTQERTGFEPDVNVRHVKLNGIRIDFDEVDRKSMLPAIHLDVSLKLDLLITNRNFFGANYDKVFAHIKYRGDELGQMESTGGRVPARSAVRAEAALELQGKQLYQHVPELLVDVANRELPLEVVAVFFGVVEAFFINKNEKVTATCNVVIDPKDKVILSQECNLV